jgi:3-hydroxymyristoyl/3-hydroxydecanoyl-(acyl carrier protein) dehydratase
MHRILARLEDTVHIPATACEPFRLLAAGGAERERLFRVEIPGDSPLFSGHFPGHPILPGIAHLAMAERALGAPLAAIRSLKLRRPVAPGEVLALSLKDPEGDGWTRFELRRDGEAVSGGAIRTAPPGGVPVSEAPRPAGGFPPIEDLLPHAPPSRLLRGIVEASPAGITALAEVPPEHPIARHAGIPAFLGIEAAAQAAAALEALDRRQEAPGPRIGYLVGIREARFGAATLPTVPFRVTARLQGRAFPLSIYEIAVGEPGRETVTGTISTYLMAGDDAIRDE